MSGERAIRNKQAVCRGLSPSVRVQFTVHTGADEILGLGGEEEVRKVGSKKNKGVVERNFFLFLFFTINGTSSLKVQPP